jgi:HEAT repeat protein
MMVQRTEPAAPAAPPLAEANAQVSLLGRIPESHPVRLAALSVARGEPIASIQPLIDALLDPSPDRWRVRAVAAWALSRTALTPEETDAATASLLDVLERARPERARDILFRLLKRHAALSLSAGTLAAVIVMLLLSRPWNYNGPELPEVWAIMTCATAFMGLPLIIPASLSFDRNRDSRARVAAAEALGRLGQPESVGALSGALFDRSWRVRDAAAAALHRVLPVLTLDHYGLFGSQSIANLGRALGHPDAQLVSKALSALAAVGTSHAIPFVKRLTTSGRTLRLREAAEEVLAILERRQQSESVHATLLRPTQSPNDSAQVLVRAATNVQSTGELLLRTARDGEG